MAVNGSAPNVNGLPYMGTRPQSKPRTQPQSQPRVQQQSPTQKAQREKVRKERNRTTTKTKNYNFNVNAAPSAGQGGAGQQRTGLGDLQPSAGGLRSFCERGRKVLREASSDLAYAEELLRNSLREVAPPPGQGKSAAYMRANRVARSLKRAGNATQAASAHCARTWMAYTREYEQELADFGGPRVRPHRAHNFGA